MQDVDSDMSSHGMAEDIPTPRLFTAEGNNSDTGGTTPEESYRLSPSRGRKWKRRNRQHGFARGVDVESYAPDSSEGETPEQSYRVGDFIEFEPKKFGKPERIGAIMGLRMSRQTHRDESEVIAQVKVYYRHTDLPEIIYQRLICDRNCDLYGEFGGFLESQPTIQNREVFKSERTEYIGANTIRSRCCVIQLSEPSTVRRFVPTPHTYFTLLAYNPDSRKLAVIQGEIRIGSGHQAKLPECRPSVAPSDRDVRVAPPGIGGGDYGEELLWVPGQIERDELDMFVTAVRSMVATNASMSDRQSPDSSTSMACRDETTVAALHQLHQVNYDKNRALSRIVDHIPHLRSVDRCWSEDDSKLFMKGIRVFQKNFFKIRKGFLPYKDTKELVDYYYYWKKEPICNVRAPGRRGKGKKSKNSASSNGEGSSDSDADSEGFTCFRCDTEDSAIWHYVDDHGFVCEVCKLNYRKGEEGERLPEYMFRPVEPAKFRRMPMKRLKTESETRDGSGADGDTEDRSDGRSESGESFNEPMKHDTDQPSPSKQRRLQPPLAHLQPQPVKPIAITAPVVATRPPVTTAHVQPHHHVQPQPRPSSFSLPNPTMSITNTSLGLAVTSSSVALPSSSLPLPTTALLSTGLSTVGSGMLQPPSLTQPSLEPLRHGGMSLIPGGMTSHLQSNARDAAVADFRAAELRGGEFRATEDPLEQGEIRSGHRAAQRPMMTLADSSTADRGSPSRSDTSSPICVDPTPEPPPRACQEICHRTKNACFVKCWKREDNSCARVDLYYKPPNGSEMHKKRESRQRETQQRETQQAAIRPQQHSGQQQRPHMSTIQHTSQQQGPKIKSEPLSNSGGVDVIRHTSQTMPRSAAVQPSSIGITSPRISAGQRGDTRRTPEHNAPYRGGSITQGTVTPGGHRVMTPGSRAGGVTPRSEPYYMASGGALGQLSQLASGGANRQLEEMMAAAMRAAATPNSMQAASMMQAAQMQMAAMASQMQMGGGGPNRAPGGGAAAAGLGGASALSGFDPTQLVYYRLLRQSAPPEYLERMYQLTPEMREKLDMALKQQDMEMHRDKMLMAGAGASLLENKTMLDAHLLDFQRKLAAGGGFPPGGMPPFSGVPGLLQASGLHSAAGPGFPGMPGTSGGLHGAASLGGSNTPSAADRERLHKLGLMGPEPGMTSPAERMSSDRLQAERNLGLPLAHAHTHTHTHLHLHQQAEAAAAQAAAAAATGQPFSNPLTQQLLAADPSLLSRLTAGNGGGAGGASGVPNYFMNPSLFPGGIPTSLAAAMMPADLAQLAASGMRPDIDPRELLAAQQMLMAQNPAAAAQLLQQDMLQRQFGENRDRNYQ